jgi:hypothetical protein
MASIAVAAITGLSMSSSTDAFWWQDDEPVQRRSKLNFGQNEVLAELQLCNLRQKLEFTKYRPRIAFRRGNPRAIVHMTRRGELARELRNTVNTRHVNTRDNAYRVGHGMIGTVLIAFAGEPLTILVLMAR